jgi:hypothetical protein
MEYEVGYAPEPSERVGEIMYLIMIQVYTEDM